LLISEIPNPFLTSFASSSTRAGASPCGVSLFSVAFSLSRLSSLVFLTASESLLADWQSPLDIGYNVRKK